MKKEEKRDREGEKDQKKVGQMDGDLQQGFKLHPVFSTETLHVKLKTKFELLKPIFLC